MPLKDASERTVIVGPPAPATLPPATDAPASILIVAEQRRPTQAEVAQSISELSNAAANVLRAEEPLKLRVPVLIFDRFNIERVQIKNDHGWAYLQMDSNASIAEDGADFKRRHESVRWELRRTESGWIKRPRISASPPHEAPCSPGLFNLEIFLLQDLRATLAAQLDHQLFDSPRHDIEFSAAG